MCTTKLLEPTESTPLAHRAAFRIWASTSHGRTQTSARTKPRSWEGVVRQTSHAVSGRAHSSLPMIWAKVWNGCLPHHPANQTFLGVSLDFFLVCQNKPPKQAVGFISSTHIELTSALFCIKSCSIWRYNSKPSGLSLAIRCCAHYTCYKEKG